MTEKVTLVIGARSGIGQVIAIEFANKNIDLALFDIESEGLNETRRLIKSSNSLSSVLTMDVDVSSYDMFESHVECCCDL